MKRKIVALCLAAVMAVAVVTPARAASPRATAINVAYGITLKFNNRVANLTDVNGKTVQPFVYQGTTYVPIRAVSELFGATVSYDGSTNTAYVYDDFAQVCAVIHEMSSIVNDANLLLKYEVDSAIEGDYLDYTTWFDACGERITNMFNVIETEGQKNNNRNIPYGDISIAFGKYVVAFGNANSAYEQLSKNKNSDYYADKYTDYFKEATNNYINVCDRIDAFFRTYCTYQDLGF